MDFWKRDTVQRENAWKYLIGTIDPEIALIQEIVPPETSYNSYHTLYHEIDGKRKWGTAVISKHSILKELYFNNCYPGSSGLIVCEIKASDDLLTVINIYGQLDASGYASTTMHHLLSDLTQILNKKNKRKIILGGDFNVSEQFDEVYKGEFPSHKFVFDRLENFGLVNCTKKHYNGHIQTHIHSRSKFDWQNDYLFVSENIFNEVKSCEVINREELLDFSDHLPVTIELKI